MTEQYRVPSRRDALDSIREQIVGLSLQVPLLDGTTRQQISLDNSASTPVLRPVLEAVNAFVPWYSSVHRGAGYKSRVATQAYEEARALVGRFFGARSDQHVVIFGKNTTEAINKLTRRIPFQPGDVVLCSMMEHHSNDLPWRSVAEVARIGLDPLGRVNEEHYAALLRQFAGRVRLVALSGASNVTGAMAPIHRFAAQAHAAGAEIFVDCAQLAPHRAIDIGDLSDPGHLDYIALSAHKLYAPFGTGALIGRRDTFTQGTPDMVGGGMVEMVTAAEVNWAPPPAREEAGSPNVVGAVALAAALTTLSAIGMDRIAAHEMALTTYALRRLAEIPGLRLYGDSDPTAVAQRLGVVPFTIAGVSHFLVSVILSSEFGIEVRNGMLCAQPYLRHVLDLTPEDVARFQAAMRAGDRCALPGLVRASFGLYNTTQEIDALANALSVIARGAYRGQYAQDPATGAFHAQGWQPDLSASFTLCAHAPEAVFAGSRA